MDLMLHLAPPATTKIAARFIVALLASAAAARSFALTTLGYEPQLHERFYVGPDRAFIGEGQPWSRPGDWSGVGRINDPHLYEDGTTVYNWWTITMISEHYFVTAYHVRPNRYGDNLSEPVPPIRFYRNDQNPSATPESHPDEVWEGTVEILPGNWQYTGWQVGMADLWLGRMEDAPPDWVRRAPLVKRNQESNWLNYLDPTVYMLGEGAPPFHYSNFRMGRNTLENRFTAFTRYDVQSPPGLGADEARLDDKDSSHSAFVITPAGPAVFNINVGAGGGPTMPDNIDGILALIEQHAAEYPGETEHVAVVTDLLGDLDGNYYVDNADAAILASNLNTASGATYLMGDLNRDGAIIGDDQEIMSAQLGKRLNPVDFDLNQTVDINDFATIAQNWDTPAGAAFRAGDGTGDGLVNIDDVLKIDIIRGSVFMGQPPLQIAGDANNDGAVTTADFSLWAANKNRTDVTPFSEGDVTGDGAVTHEDLVLIRDNHGHILADVDGNTRVNPADVSVLTDPANWLQTTSGGTSAGDVNFDGIVDNADLAAVGSFLGFAYRIPTASRNIGILPGDYDGDLDIDAGDLMVWQRTLGSTEILTADGDNSGVVDAGDLAIWRDNFEAVSPSPPTTAIPEPVAAVMFIACGLACAYHRRLTIARFHRRHVA
jgi:hypothetical protein